MKLPPDRRSWYVCPAVQPLTGAPFCSSVRLNGLVPAAQVRVCGDLNVSASHPGYPALYPAANPITQLNNSAVILVNGIGATILVKQAIFPEATDANLKPLASRKSSEVRTIHS